MIVFCFPASRGLGPGAPRPPRVHTDSPINRPVEFYGLRRSPWKKGNFGPTFQLSLHPRPKDPIRFFFWVPRGTKFPSAFQEGPKGPFHSTKGPFPGPSERPKGRPWGRSAFRKMATTTLPKKTKRARPGGLQILGAESSEKLRAGSLNVPPQLASNRAPQFPQTTTNNPSIGTKKIRPRPWGKSKRPAITQKPTHNQRARETWPNFNHPKKNCFRIQKNLSNLFYPCQNLGT